MAETHVWKEPNLNLSKTTISRFEECPLRYYCDKVERRTGLMVRSPAGARGEAAHGAVADILKQGTTVDADDPVAAAVRAMANTTLPLEMAGVVGGWTAEALAFARNRGGTYRWVEDFLKMDCHSGSLANVTLWARPDLVISDGYIAPLEVIDWTFGRPRVESATQLIAALSTAVLRLVVGHVERVMRPIAITEVHVPSMTAITVVPSDEDVLRAWERVGDSARAVRQAIAASEFPAQPGPHCRYCSHVDVCVARTGRLDFAPQRDSE